jgi:TP901-1 family phage major tail protein
MVKQVGRAMLVKIGDGAGSEAFTPLCGLNSKTITINRNSIDATTADCTTPGGALWRETLAGLQSIDISGDGIFEDEASETRLHDIAFSAADNSVNLEIVVPDFGTYAGAFRPNNLEFSGETEGSLTFSVSFESTGAVTFTAA